MMTRILFLLTILVAPILAAEVPDAVPEALRPLAPLVGPKWMATFPNGKLTDEQKFEWVYGGKFLRNEHWVRDEQGKTVYEGETIYSWDPLSGKIVWWYWNTTGGYITGTMTSTAEGWLAEGENHAPKTQTPRVRGLIRAITPESYESVQLFDREGTWVEQFAITYKPQIAKAEAKLPLFIVHFTTGPAWVQDKPFPEQPHAREHSANLQRLRTLGSIPIGARYGETGMVILRAESDESARAEIDRDPAVKSGTFKYTLSALRPFYNGCLP